MDTFLFDKTGTITTSYPLVEKVLPFGDYTEKDILRISACLEEHIYHPIANAIVNKLKLKGLNTKKCMASFSMLQAKGLNRKLMVNRLSLEIMY